MNYLSICNLRELPNPEMAWDPSSLITRGDCKYLRLFDVLEIVLHATS